MTPTTIVRFPDWEERLALYLDTRADMPFRWGHHDCALFAAGAVKAMSGVDPAEVFRDKYDTSAGAALALREHGAGTLLRTCVEWFGASKHISQAKRGDLVMRNRTTLGVCVGQWSWFVGQDDFRAGLISEPTAICSKAFTIPFAAVVE
ncbi:MAG: hypothetical protein ABW128_21845 [Rhizorhabdus sp.]